MTTVTAKVNREKKDLEMFINCGVSKCSFKFLGIYKLHIEWNVGEENQEIAVETCMPLVNTCQMEV